MEQLLEFLSDLFLSIYFAIVDALDSFLPSTSPQYQIGTMMSNLPADNFAFYFVVECAQVLFTVLGLVVVYKLIKILPFT